MRNGGCAGPPAMVRFASREFAGFVEDTRCHPLPLPSLLYLCFMAQYCAADSPRKQRNFGRGSFWSLLTSRTAITFLHALQQQSPVLSGEARMRSHQLGALGLGLLHELGIRVSLPHLGSGNCNCPARCCAGLAPLGAPCTLRLSRV